MGNPFEEKLPFKKRIISASLTEPQRDAFDALKQRTGCAGDGEMIKKALAHMIETWSPTPTEKSE